MVSPSGVRLTLVQLEAALWMFTLPRFDEKERNRARSVNSKACDAPVEAGNHARARAGRRRASAERQCFRRQSQARSVPCEHRPRSRGQV